jgi:hypothetical protein
MDDLFSIAVCDVPVVIILFILAVMGLAAFIGYWQRQRTSKKWSQLAARTGLTLEGGSWFVKPRLHGEYRRHTLELTTYTESSGTPGDSSSATYTLITLYLTHSSKMLAISPSGLTGVISKVLGMQDVQIGNEAFDKRFTIKSQPPEFAGELLGGDTVLCDSVARLKKSGWFELRVQGSQMTYRESGRETNPNRLEAIFNTLSDLADRIEHGKL